MGTLGEAERVNKTGDGPSILITGDHLPTLFKQLPKKRKPPAVLRWYLISLIHALEGTSRVAPWTYLEFFLNVLQILASCARNITADHSSKYSYFPAGTTSQFVAKTNKLAQQLLSQ